MSAVDSLRAAVEKVLADKTTPDSSKAELEQINKELEEITAKISEQFPVDVVDSTVVETPASSMAATDEVTQDVKIPS